MCVDKNKYNTPTDHGGRHRPTAAMGAPLPVPPHVTISQNVVRQDFIVKTKKHYNFYSYFTF